MDNNDLLKRKNDLMEICPALMLGVMASAIPFSDHNQCAVSTENVLMADGSFKKIKDVKIGDEVITFDPDTQEQSITKVINTITWKTEKDVFKITTINGRTISTTYDHKFMTNNGWTKLENFDKNNTLLAITMEPRSVSIKVDEYVILDEKKFRTSCFLNNVTLNSIEKYIDGVKHLFPLKSNSPSLHIISRMFGFILTDGYTSDKFNSFTVSFGHEYSAKLFEQDVKILGFDTKIPEFIVGCERFGSTYQTKHTGSLSLLFFALGMVRGGKTKQEAIDIPDWIMNGSNMVKREFLAGYQGGDGSKIKSGRDDQIHIQIGSTSKTIQTQYLDSLVSMMSDIIKLFRDLDIDVSDVKCETTKNYPDKTTVHYFISSSRKNLIKYFDTIGYRYDVYKQVKSGILVEYMRYLEYEYDKKIELIEKIKGCGDINRKLIAEKLNIPVNKVYNLLKLRYKSYGLPKGLLTVKQWMDIVQVKATTIFLPISLIEKSNENIVSDISVESKNYSFICGDGFCIHNCIMYNEPVYMADGSFKEIKDVKIDDEVITFHPQTQEQSVVKVVETFMKKTDKLMFTITTESGREITATFDHRFMTSNGWIRLEHLKEISYDYDDWSLIGISLEPIPYRFYKNNNPQLLVDYKSSNYYKELSEYLPLYDNNPKLPILSRLIGAVLNKTIYLNDEGEYCFVMNFEHENDVRDFENDIKYLDIKIQKYIFSKKKVFYYGVLPFLLKMLIFQVDEHEHNIKLKNNIPNWIINGTKHIQKEFLSSFLCIQNDCSSMDVDVAKKIECMLKVFGINPVNLSKEKFESLHFSILMDTAMINFIKYYNKIGIRYNYNMKIKHGLQVEFLMYVKHQRDEGFIPVEFHTWKNRVIVKDNTIFIPIARIKKSLEDMICDITVDSPNQSFLCGDAFCVHNSPRNIYQSSEYFYHFFSIIFNNH
jgi:hypothetical protein